MRFVYAAAAVLLACAPANAATLSLRIQATNFERVGTPTDQLPLPGFSFFSLAGTFDVADPTTGFTVDIQNGNGFFTNFPTPLTLKWTAYTQNTGIYEIFREPNGRDLLTDEDDLYILVENARDFGGRVSEFRISRASAPGGYWISRSTFTGVPEPATWALMILGFGAIGVARRRGLGAQIKGQSILEA